MTFRQYIVLLVSEAFAIAVLTTGGLILSWQPWNLRVGGKIEPFGAVVFCLCVGSMAAVSFLAAGLLALLAFWLIQKGKPNRPAPPSAGIAPQSIVQNHCPGAPEPGRWMLVRAP
jgi:hypothetical protein